MEGRDNGEVGVRWSLRTRIFHVGVAFCDVWGICGESIEGGEREVMGEIEEGRDEEGDRGEGDR